MIWYLDDLVTELLDFDCLFFGITSSITVTGTLTSIVLNSESETPLPLASTITGASPVRTTVTKNAVLAEPLAGTFTRSRRKSSISEKITQL